MDKSARCHFHLPRLKTVTMSPFAARNSHSNSDYHQNNLSKNARGTLVQSRVPFVSSFNVARGDDFARNLRVFVTFLRKRRRGAVHSFGCIGATSWTLRKLVRTYFRMFNGGKNGGCVDSFGDCSHTLLSIQLAVAPYQFVDVDCCRTVPE